jgi:hypothetical protein
MEGLTYKIKLKKDNFEVEVQGDKDWVENKFTELTSLKGQEGQKKGEEKRIIIGEMPATIVEFFELKGNPKRHADIAVSCAYWLSKVKNVQFFNAKDIEDCYDEIKEPKPRNMNDVLDSNIEKRWFGEHSGLKNGKKAWEILRTGIEYVEQMKNQ